MVEYKRMNSIVVYKNPVTGMDENLFECVTGDEAKKAIEYLEKLDNQIKAANMDFQNLHAEYESLKKKDEILNDNKLFSRRLLERNNNALTIAVGRLGESNEYYLKRITELYEENLKLQSKLEKRMNHD